MFLYLLPFFISFFLLIIYENTPFQHKRLYFFILLALAIFGGTRFETGQDWVPYKTYYDQLFISKSFIADYFDTWFYKRFEIGFYFLNVFFKYLEFPYYSISFISCFIWIFAFYYFTKDLAVNRFTILTIYLSYSFLILEFAQVRQAIAIGFFLIGFKIFLNKSKLLMTVLCFGIALSFQYSTIIYILIFSIIMFLKSSYKSDLVLVFLSIMLLVFLNQIGIFNVIKNISPQNLQEKVDIYKEEQNAQGIGQIIYSFFLLVIGFYIYKFSMKLYGANKLLCRYAAFSIAATIVTSLIFPGNYVMYSRMYIIASLFLGIALSIIVKNFKHSFHKIVLYLVVLISFIYYCRLIIFYEKEYVPYKSWFFYYL